MGVISNGNGENERRKRLTKLVTIFAQIISSIEEKNGPLRFTMQLAGFCCYFLAFLILSADIFDGKCWRLLLTLYM